MKKGFVSILTLFVLLVLSLTITFVYGQNENTSEYVRDLYNKKQAIYLAESVMNSYLVENYDKLGDIILKNDLITDKKKTDNYELNESANFLYNGKSYYIKIYHKYYDEDMKLQDVYKVSLENVSVGDSKSDSALWFKVIEEDDDLENDKKSIKMIIRSTY
ncbi:hypothetical protein [Anaerococcus sp. Marseille-Q5996]|uniref:hypothetical protein n=1 Tax=Anaerococcus sp. Marseille-Q5996 TaxID=2972769 RepID=UPI0021CA17F0|nr:hypothetical protein [Anaerococcus sp. Marseille-Q5996]